MPAARLPRGTLTLAFTDIEGSTRLLEQLGSGYAAALHEHRSLLRSTFRRHGGVEVDTQGDAFFFVFPSASGALAAAAEAQPAKQEGLLHVRIGLHTGEPELTTDGYVGLCVHEAARICAAAHGGQVLLSNTTAQLVDADLDDLGLHRLKDIPMPRRLFQLGHVQHPPLRTLNNTTLPDEMTSLLGRDALINTVVAALRQRRLVTLTGPGGVGKTRAAIRAASNALGEFSDGCWFIDLAAITDPALVPAALVSGLRLSDRGAESQLDRIVDALRDRDCLLLIDNCEHLQPAPATAAQTLLQRCRQLRVLATSREPLHLDGEEVVQVDPLSTTARQDAADLSPAAELFIDRAALRGFPWMRPRTGDRRSRNSAGGSTACRLQ